jgi:hypothetical protein
LSTYCRDGAFGDFACERISDAEHAMSGRLPMVSTMAKGSVMPKVVEHFEDWGKELQYDERKDQ